jgi:hypothetical protein
MRDNDNILEAFLFILFILLPCSYLIIYIFGYIWGSLILSLISVISISILFILEELEGYIFNTYIMILLISFFQVFANCFIEMYYI